MLPLRKEKRKVRNSIVFFAQAETEPNNLFTLLSGNVPKLMGSSLRDSVPAIDFATTARHSNESLRITSFSSSSVIVVDFLDVIAVVIHRCGWKTKIWKWQQQT